MCKHLWSLSSHSHLHMDWTRTSVVHLSLVSLRLPASTDTWKARGKMGQDPSSFCREETRGNFQQKHRNPRKRKYLCNSKSSFFQASQELKGTINVLHLTFVTQSKQSTGAKVRILQQEKQSTPPAEHQGHTQFQTLHEQRTKDKKGVFSGSLPSTIL